MYSVIENNSNIFIIIFAAALIIKKFYMLSNYDNTKLMKNLLDKLNDREKELYKKIKLERFEIYSRGSLYGILALFIYLILTRNDNNLLINVLIAIIISNLITYLYYSLSKKSDYMIKYLDTQEEREAWLEIYKTMKNNCHAGFLIGIVISGLLAFVIKQNI